MIKIFMVINNKDTLDLPILKIFYRDRDFMKDFIKGTLNNG